MISLQKVEMIEKKKLSGRLCVKVGLCHLLTLHSPFREKKRESISHRCKQVLEERGGLPVQRACLESDLLGAVCLWQSQTTWKGCAVAHNSVSLPAGLCIYSVPLCQPHVSHQLDLRL